MQTFPGPTAPTTALSSFCPSHRSRPVSSCWVKARIPLLIGLLSVMAFTSALAQCVNYHDYIHWIGGTHLSGRVSDVAVSGRTAYVADGDGGLLIVDVGSPSTPRITGRVSTPGSGMAVVARGEHAYLADGVDGFKVIDVTNPAAPWILGGVDTPGHAMDIALSGNNAYVADLDGGLQVIDLTGLSVPTVVGAVEVPGNARCLAVSGHYAYVGNAQGTIHVIDITEPTAPVAVASVPEPNGATATCVGIVVSGSTLYSVLTYWLGWGFTSYSIWTIDITDPVSPTAVGNLISYGRSASDIALSGNYAIVTRVPSGFSTSGDFQVIDVTSAAAPELLTTIPVEYDAVGVSVSEGTAYIVEEAECGSQPCGLPDPDRRSGIQIFAIANPSAPPPVGTLNGNFTRVAVSGSYAYAADRTGSVTVIDVEDPTNPVIVGSSNLLPWIVDIAVSGNHVFAANGSTLGILDVTDPTAPIPLGQVDTRNAGGALAVSTDFVYVSGNSIAVSGNHVFTQSGFLVIDATDPTNPAIVGQVDRLAAWPHPLRVVDVTDPTNPVVVGIVDTPTGAAIAAQGNYIYTSDGLSAFHVIDVSNPTTPTIVGTLATHGVPDRLAVSGSFAYLDTYPYNVQVIDISNPTAPATLGDLPAGAGYSTDIAVANGYLYVGIGSFAVYPLQCEALPSAAVSFDLEPGVINFSSRARWVTALIDPVGFNPGSIDPSSILLAGSVPVAAVEATGHRVVMKFEKALLDPILNPGLNVLELTGMLETGQTFSGMDTVQVVKPSRGGRPSLEGTIVFTTTKPGPVSVRLFDVQGRLVRDLKTGVLTNPGSHQVRFDGREGGKMLASGIYFYQVETDEGTATGRISIIR